MKFRDPLEIREWADDPRLSGFEDAFFQEGGVLNAKVNARSQRALESMGADSRSITVFAGVLRNASRAWWALFIYLEDSVPQAVQVRRNRELRCDCKWLETANEG